MCEYEYFKRFKNKRKPFGKFTMLLESLIDSDSEILINEHLYNPKTNSLSKEKISFVLMYIPKNESKEINLNESHTFVQEQLFHRPNLKLNIAENILKIAKFTLDPIKSIQQNDDDLISQGSTEYFQNKTVKLNFNRMLSNITSWQITVKISQLKCFNYRQKKDLKTLDSTENVYCMIQIENTKKYTKFKTVGSGLIFNEVYSKT